MPIKVDLSFRKGSLFTLLLLIFFIGNETACSRLTKKPTQSLDFKVLSQEKSLIFKIMAKASERMKYFKSLKALAEVSVKFPQKKIKRKNIIIFRNDPSIRFESLSVLGRPFMYFTASKEATSLYYPDRNTLYKGGYSPKNMARIIGIAIDLQNIVTILSGNFTIPSNFKNVVLNESKDYYLMKFFLLNNRNKEVFLDKESFLPLQVVEYITDEDDVITVEFNNYKKINNYFLPFRIKIELPKKKSKIFIKYLSAQLNQGVLDSSFELPIQKGVKIFPLEIN